MQKEIKRVLSLSILVFGVVFLAGCGVKTEMPKTGNLPVQKNSVDQNAKENTPDTKNTNLNSNSVTSADSEESLLSQEEADAKDALPSDQETDDLSNSYDENNL